MRLYENPYVYVRTRVMKTLLLSRLDYDKIMKMGVNEILHFLEESAYKREIDENAYKVSGVDLLEVALNASFLNSIIKLKRISDDALRHVINVYMGRWDFENVKVVLRGFSTHASREEVERLILPLGEISAEDALNMFDTADIETVLRESKLLSAAEIKEVMSLYKKNGSLSAIENFLDQKYYNDVILFSRRLEGGLLFGSFLTEEIEAKNIVTLVRLRKNNTADNVIMESLIKVDGNAVLPNAKLLKAKSAEDIFEMLKRTRYAEIVPKSVSAYKESDSLMEFENLMKHHLLAKTTLLSHQYPLSVDVILGYMFAKELEVNNLKTIVRGKSLGVDDEFISGQLVVA